MKLRKAGANWVEGDRFYNREVELEALRERVGHGTHTPLTAQRRMGKTSLVRELLRLLEDEDRFATVFVDLEASSTPQDAVAEMAAGRSPFGAHGSGSGPGSATFSAARSIGSTRCPSRNCR